jgi:alpha-ketoglutarate-dependent taurine dioxygenase
MIDSLYEELSPFGAVLAAKSPGAPLSSLDGPRLARHIQERRVLILRGFAPPSGDALPAFAGAFGEILDWDFGAINELKVRPDAKNYLYTDRAVPFHWDGAFVGRVPSYIFFHCEVAPPPGSGGETLFCDTTRLVTRLSPEERARLEKIRITYSTEKIVHYGGRFTAPLFGVHPRSRDEILRFAEPVEDLNPVSLEIEGLAPGAEAAFLEEMRVRLYDPAVCYAHSWREGDVVIADNHSLLHGRRAFLNVERRHLRRVNVL